MLRNSANDKEVLCEAPHGTVHAHLHASMHQQNTAIGIEASSAHRYLCAKARLGTSWTYAMNVDDPISNLGIGSFAVNEVASSAYVQNYVDLTQLIRVQQL